MSGPPYSLIAASAAALAAAAIAAGSFIFAYNATHPPRRNHPGGRETGHLPIEDISFPSRDGIKLAGWLVRHPEATAAIVLCHGFPSERGEMLGWARPLYDAGFHLLLFDFRALGESEGDVCTIGGLEVNDLAGALDFLAAQEGMGNVPVGVFGISMGGAVAIMTAADDERIRAVATHGAYATLDRAIAQRCRNLFGRIGPVIHRPSTLWGRRWLDRHPSSVSPEAAIGRIAPRPVLLIHGALDRVVSPADVQSLHDAAGEPKQLVVLAGSPHVHISVEELSDYEGTLVRFFQRSLTYSEDARGIDNAEGDNL